MSPSQFLLPTVRSSFCRDVTPDGKRFLISEPTDATGQLNRPRHRVKPLASRGAPKNDAGRNRCRISVKNRNPFHNQARTAANANKDSLTFVVRKALPSRSLVVVRPTLARRYVAHTELECGLPARVLSRLGTEPGHRGWPPQMALRRYEKE